MKKSKIILILMIGVISALLSVYSKIDKNNLIFISGFSLWVLSLVSMIKITKNDIIKIFILGVFLYVLEIIAANTGIIYGDFKYNPLWQPAILGTPIVMLLVWANLVKESYYISNLFTTKKIPLLIITGFSLVFLDMVIDPGAVHMGLWSWKESGIWYGIPISNYVGWLILSLIGSIILQKIKFKKTGNPIIYFYTLGFWTTYVVLNQMYGVFIVGLILIIIILKKLNKNFSNI